MSVRIRFVLVLTLLVSIILSSALLIVYNSFERNTRQEFENKLWVHGYTAFLENYHLSESDPVTLEKIQYYLPVTPLNFRCVILDSAFKPVATNPTGWHYRVDTSLLAGLPVTKQRGFRDGQMWGVAFNISKDGRQGYVITEGYDEYAERKLAFLKNLMIITAVAGIVITGVFAFLYVMAATRPLVQMSLQMRNINENNLKNRVKVGKGNLKKNEIVQIATNYNNMLNRLEKAFQLQKNFVHHASHELRTPLATMLSQTESALRKELTVPEAYRVLQSLKEDQQEMIDLTNSLLLLSQYENINYSIHWPKVRIDELVQEMIITVQKMFPDIKISFDFIDEPEKESYLYFPGNETLLRSAFRNLIKNAYLYSDNKKVAITMEAQANAVYIHFENKGPVLSQEDKERMFLPFFRGDNAQRIKGFGLGLSIVRRIAELHKGAIIYDIIEENINRFTLLLKRS